MLQEWRRYIRPVPFSYLRISTTALLPSLTCLTTIQSPFTRGSHGLSRQQTASVFVLWIEFINAVSVSDGKTKITILILRRGTCLGLSTKGRSQADPKGCQLMKQMLHAVKSLDKNINVLYTEDPSTSIVWSTNPTAFILKEEKVAVMLFWPTKIGGKSA